MTLEEIKIQARFNYIVDTNLIEAAKCLYQFADLAFVGWSKGPMAKAEDKMKDSYIELVQGYLDLLTADAFQIGEIEDNNDDEK
jgi:hypothetical protein